MPKPARNAAESLGYNVRSYERIKEEELIDDKLHAQILMVVADSHRYPPPQTLVLVTGEVIVYIGLRIKKKSEEREREREREIGKEEKPLT